MIFDLKLADRAKCSNEEKKELEPLVQELIEYSKKARREGLLALEDEISEINNNPLLKIGMQLIVDGTPPDVVKEIMLTDIYFNESTGKKLLEKCIILDGVLSIQSGDNPRIIMKRLAMYLGEIGLTMQDNDVYAVELNKYLNDIEEQQIYSENTGLLDQVFAKLNDISIQRVLCETDMNDVAMALSGASGAAVKRVLNNMSSFSKSILVEEIERYKTFINEALIIESQRKFLEIIKKLEEFGEIIVKNN